VTYQFEVPGRPRAKQSARAARTASGVRFFQPPDVTNYHGRVSALARQAIPAPIAGAVHLRLSIVLRTPASWSKKRRAFLNHATTRPDVDNATKAIMDGLNGVAWVDDKQVVDLRVEKHYGNRDAVVVTVTIA
jgi:Holliday junction resolvase RusA-like endonuclease